jgi:hypothetical protein
MNALGMEPGNYLVIKLRCHIQCAKFDQSFTSSLQGELKLKVEKSSAHGATFKLLRLGLYGPGFETSGPISLRGRNGRGTLIGRHLKVVFNAGLTYIALEQHQYVPNPEAHHFGATRELFSGELQVDFQGPISQAEWPVGLRRLSLVEQEQDLGLIDAITSEGPVIAGTARLFNLNAALSCSPELRCFRRRLRLRAVFFQDNLSDPPTGSHWPIHRDAAARIWSKCGILLEETTPPVIIPDPILKQGLNPFAVVFSHWDQDGIILVFYVAGNATGSGWTFGDGAAFARTIISDQVTGNINVLAHELGHILDGDDFGGASTTTTWTGEQCTVLVANGSFTVPNFDRNSLHNCQYAHNDALEDLQQICITPDPSTTNC